MTSFAWLACSVLMFGACLKTAEATDCSSGSNTITVVDGNQPSVPRECTPATAPTGTPATVYQIDGSHDFGTTTSAACNAYVGTIITPATPCAECSCPGASSATEGACSTEPSDPCWIANTKFRVVCYGLDSVPAQTVVTNVTWTLLQPPQQDEEHHPLGSCHACTVTTCRWSSSNPKFGQSGWVKDCTNVTQL